MSLVDPFSEREQAGEVACITNAGQARFRAVRHCSQFVVFHHVQPPLVKAALVGVIILAAVDDTRQGIVLDLA